jgi:hypothetical protein
VQLRLSGPVESPVLEVPTDVVIEDFNGAHLIFSSLRITTAPDQVPEPGTLGLLMFSLTVGAALRRRQLRLAA